MILYLVPSFYHANRKTKAAVFHSPAYFLDIIYCINKSRDKFLADTLFKFRVLELLYCQWVLHHAAPPFRAEIPLFVGSGLAKRI